MLKLEEPKSYLRLAKNMTVGELKNVTNKDMLEYTAEFTTTIEPAYRADKGAVEEVNIKLVSHAISVYGEHSKQHKYLRRNFSKGESLADTHYANFASPHILEMWVKNAKTGMYDDGCVPAMNYERKDV